MAIPVKTGFPLGLEIADGYIVRFRAIDPTTGADVAGVVVSEVSVQADNVSGSDSGAPQALVPKVNPDYFANETMV